MKRNNIEMIEKCGYTCEAGALENNTDWQAIKENINNPVGVAPIGSFSWALIRLKEGAKMQRSGWNGKGMYVYYVPAARYKACTDNARKEFGDMVPYEPYFAIKNVKDTVSTWIPSINDCLAEDWEVVE